jgi:hypothetical protein
MSKKYKLDLLMQNECWGLGQKEKALFKRIEQPIFSFK